MTGLVSKNVVVSGRRTSIRLEPQMWSALNDIAEREKCTLYEIMGVIDQNRSKGLSFTASVRLFLLLYYKKAATEEGHENAGHGNFSKMVNRAQRTNSISSRWKAKRSSILNRLDNSSDLDGE